jgi:hypothetical protein
MRIHSSGLAIASDQVEPTMLGIGDHPHIEAAFSAPEMQGLTTSFIRDALLSRAEAGDAHSDEVRRLAEIAGALIPWSDLRFPQRLPLQPKLAAEMLALHAFALPGTISSENGHPVVTFRGVRDGSMPDLDNLTALVILNMASVTKAALGGRGRIQTGRVGSTQVGVMLELHCLADQRATVLEVRAGVDKKKWVAWPPQMIGEFVSKLQENHYEWVAHLCRSALFGRAIEPTPAEQTPLSIWKERCTELGERMRVYEVDLEEIFRQARCFSSLPLLSA